MTHPVIYLVDCIHGLFIRNLLIWNLHVDDRNTRRAYTTSRKEPRELLNLKSFIFASSQELRGRFHSFAAEIHTDAFSGAATGDMRALAPHFLQDGARDFFEIDAKYLGGEVVADLQRS